MRLGRAVECDPDCDEAMLVLSLIHHHTALKGYAAGLCARLACQISATPASSSAFRHNCWPLPSPPY
ncbi:MAG: hypothetical protein OEY05_00070 [Paracoccaceae bacterium]|nr:hypothetical protein [Paracoccaceae bacterium]MDH5528405.1 hypothetical protein [Paracoccaceae bacterium]